MKDKKLPNPAELDYNEAKKKLTDIISSVKKEIKPYNSDSDFDSDSDSDDEFSIAHEVENIEKFPESTKGDETDYLSNLIHAIGINLDKEGADGNITDLQDVIKEGKEITSSISNRLLKNKPNAAFHIPTNKNENELDYENHKPRNTPNFKRKKLHRLHL